jgi:hypothetical protein
VVVVEEEGIIEGELPVDLRSESRLESSEVKRIRVLLSSGKYYDVDVQLIMSISWLRTNGVSKFAIFVKQHN